MRNPLFWITSVLMLAVVIATWGSVGSGLVLFGLIMLVGTNVTYYCQDKHAEWDLSDEEE
ncbi:MAG: hypothetical protein IJ960_07250 [Oscillospiraceae bacterium]|nr:hypothetical protein [Oscillospiraceae bacterium]